MDDIEYFFDDAEGNLVDDDSPLGDSDIDISGEEDNSDSDAEDKTESTSPNRDSIYPLFNQPRKKEINPSTGKVFKQSEITKMYHQFVNDQWADQPDLSEEEINPFTFKPLSFGCQGLQTTDIEWIEGK